MYAVPALCRDVYLYSSFAQWPNSECTVVNTSDDVGGVRGYDRPSLKSSRSSKTVSSELEVADEDIERAGVDAVEEAAELRVRARASAAETALR